MDYKDKLKLAKEALDSGSYDKETIEYIFPELAESEEKIRKELIEFVKSRGGFKQEYIAWLEKQSEQKPPVIDFKARNWYVSKVDGKIHDLTYNLTDKVEPKFKVGDWVVSPNGVYWHIDAIQNGRYEVTADTGQCGNWPLDTNIYRIWTIQDAKPGDVLSGKINGDNYILIFKQVTDGWVETYGHYYDVVDRFCAPSQLFCRDYQGTFAPATKEQRDLLFQKMKEAGYEWDTEKKELKEIDVELTDFEKSLKHIMIETLECGDTHNLKADAEMLLRFAQKPAEWSEKDEKMIGRIRGMIEAYAFSQSAVDVNGDLCEKKFIDADIWLKSLKDRVQPKQEWSEEDEKMFDYALDMIEWYSGKNENKSRLVSDWLKSLIPQSKQKWTLETI